MIEKKSNSQERVNSSFVLRKEPRVASFADGFKWFIDAFKLFGKNPFGWILLFIIWSSINLILGLVLPTLSNILWPIFLAGFMWGCYQLDKKDIFLVNCIYSGFTRKARDLLILGLYYVCALILMFLISKGLTHVFIGDLSILEDQQLLLSYYSGSLGSDQIEKLMVSIQPLLCFSLILLVLSVPVFMGIWFAPALVIINEISPLEAIKLSFLACLRNVASFISYGLISSVAIFAGIIPLGMGLLIVMPILFASIYTSYKDIFIDESGEGSEVNENKRQNTTSIEL